MDQGKEVGLGVEQGDFVEHPLATTEPGKPIVDHAIRTVARGAGLSAEFDFYRVLRLNREGGAQRFVDFGYEMDV